MRQMMFNGVKLPLHGLAGEGLFQESSQPGAATPIPQAAQHQVQVRALGKKVDHLATQIGPAVLIERNVAHV